MQQYPIITDRYRTSHIICTTLLSQVEVHWCRKEKSEIHPGKKRLKLPVFSFSNTFRSEFSLGAAAEAIPKFLCIFIVISY